ncbi:MAG: xanthine dehydrogenase family protein molybdopterin-binding subunit [Chloroflexi bacterium]|nr:xanthine dehydrogenase family protein molybdopterin-binding subunit [Chloroflexota bacterium]
MSKEFSVIGKSIPRVDARAKVTGQGKFSADLKIPGLCYAKLLGSPYPHARIKKIDVTRAQDLPGVISVITGDAPENRLYGDLYMDSYIIAKDTVRHVGDPVAAVVARSEDIARDALDRIEVEYEELPAVFDVEEAMRPDCPVVIHPDMLKYTRLPKPNLRYTPAPEGRKNVFEYFQIVKGDIDRGFAEADLIVENRYTTPIGNAAPLETPVMDAWFETDGVLTLRGKTQSMHQVKAAICNIFHLSPSKVRFLVPYVGGAFGPFCHIWPEIIAVLIVMTVQRPVRLAFDRTEQFTLSGQKPGRVIYVRDGVKRDGTIIARDITFITNYGAYAGPHGTQALVKGCTGGAISLYRHEHFRFRGYAVYTNTCPAAAFRSIGSSDMHWGMEQQMDIIAERLKMDPVELRRRHIFKEGEEDIVGEPIHSIGAEECLDTAANWIKLKEKPAPAPGPWKKGKGIALVGHWVVTEMPSWSYVKVHKDGSVEVRHAGCELGQGCDTVITQIAAEEFGVPVDKVRLITRDTDVTPFEFYTAATRLTYYIANSLARACQDAKRQIFDLAAPRLEIPAHELALGNGEIYVENSPGKRIKISDLYSPIGFLPVPGGEILGKGFFAEPAIPYDANGRSPKQWAAHPYMAYAVEIGVNTETGQVRVEKVAGVVDVGRALNPKLVEGQIEGGMGQGIGGAIFEELILEDGRVLNPSFVDFCIPTIMEIPTGKNVASLITPPLPHPKAYNGVKGVGELTIVPFFAAVGNAFYNATGIRICDLPLTRERVLKAIFGPQLEGHVPARDEGSKIASSTSTSPSEQANITVSMPLSSILKANNAITNGDG